MDHEEDDEIVDEVVESFLKNVDLNVLDDIFECFLKSANEKKIDFMKLPEIPKRRLVYMHLEIPYLSTYFMYLYNNKKNLYIRLNNNGFLYSQLPHSAEKLYRHRFPNWIQVKWANVFIKKSLSNIQNFMKRILGENCQYLFYYNQEHQRADIKGINVEENISNDEIEMVCITFECGYPYIDYAEEQNLKKFSKKQSRF